MLIILLIPIDTLQCRVYNGTDRKEQHNMTRTFIEVPLFTKRWKEIGLGEEECPQKTREIIERRSCKESR